MTAAHEPGAARRSTRQRSAVESLLAASDKFLTAAQVHEQLRAAGEAIGLATVYRQLRALADDGLADMLRRGGAGGEVSYRLCGREGHHHHLICRVCGRTVEVAGAGVEEWARRMGAAHGFTEIEHVVELTGTCRDCARRRAA